MSSSHDTSKVPNAYLFAGPPSCGKATTARALAMALNCERYPFEGCGDCAGCQKIAAATHPDYLVVTPSGAGHYIVVDEVRAILGRMSFAPHEAKTRVVVIEESERLRVEAANALLKTLEEPPPRTLFVLLTSSPDQLLATIRSRCQRVRFHPLGPGDLTEVLLASGADPDRASQAARLGGGSAGQAMELVEGDALERRTTLARKILAAAFDPRAKAAFDAAAELVEEKDQISSALALLALWYRDAAACAVGIPSEKGALPEPLRSAAGSTAASVWARRARSVLETDAALLGFAHPQLALERLIFSLRLSPKASQ